MKCYLCAAPLDGGKYCPSCGATLPPPRPDEVDPLIGMTVCDRYKILELISVGGMGRVYRARYTTLDHDVAVKLIHPHLLGFEDSVARFMAEAHIASRLNHPHVVSVHTYGRTSNEEGAHLIMVMELLQGPSLAAVLHDEPLLPFDRIADILCQTLGALSDAHARGVTHRDVKPANIIMERAAGGGDHVKLIDFGIARLETGRRLTRLGEVIGTPSYMSPEQATGKNAGVSVDLYAVGVLFYQMLTGSLPFTGSSPNEVLQRQVIAPRIDPRKVAPDRNISAAAAAVSLRAIAADANERFPDALSLAKAIHKSLTNEPWTERRAQLFRMSAGRRGQASEPVREADTVRPPRPATPPADEPTIKTTLFQPGRTAPLPERVDRLRFVGRERHVTWTMEQLGEDRQVMGVALSGRIGSGKSRLLHTVASLARDRRMLVIYGATGGGLEGEVSCTGLKQIVSRLVGVSPTDPLLVTGRAAPTDVEASGLRTIFADALPSSATPSSFVRAELAATLAWAARGAAGAADPRPVLLVIDDADRLDNVTQNALADVLRGGHIPGFRVLITCERTPSYWVGEHLVRLRIAGLKRDEAREVTRYLPVPPRITRRDEDIEPLYLEELVRWEEESEHALPAPARLVDLIEWRLRGLSPGELSTLQAVAVAGDGPRANIARVLRSPDDLEGALPTLVKGGWLVTQGSDVRLARPGLARVIEAISPEGAVAELHARAADALAERPSHVELRAYHAVRGRPDFKAFLLVDECAALRSMLGDEEGAIRALWSGMRAARQEVLRGDVETTSPWVIFGHRLGLALVAAERFDEAIDVLREILPQVPKEDIRRALILEQVAFAQAARGNQTAADRTRRDALLIARALRDEATTERLASQLRSISSGLRQVRGDRPSNRAPIKPVEAAVEVEDDSNGDRISNG